MVGIMNTFGSCFGGESTQTPEKKQSQTQVEQCNLILNVLYSDDKQKTSSENVKRERFLKKRKYLEKMGMLKGKMGTTKQKPKKFKSSLVSNETASSTNVPQLREKMATGALSNKKVIFKSDMVNSSESENKQHSPNNKISKSSINSSQPGDSSKQSAASSTNTIKPSGSGEFNFLIVPNKKVFFKYELLNPPVSEGVPESNCRAINLLRNLNIPTLPPAVINPSKYVAIDCEMVGGGPNGQLSMLARCSIVSYDGDVMFDKFIKPVLPITDYRTRWSGIRPSTLARAIPFEEAKKQILKLLRSKVVIGHAIHNDFKALGYFHPASHTRDTQKIPLLNLKGGFHVDKIISLKNMSKTILKNDIQMGKDGHSSVEDAQATMKLYRTVASDWEKVLASGFDFWGKLESLKDQNPGENVGNQ